MTAEKQKNLDDDRKQLLKERRKKEEKELEDAVKRTDVKDSEKLGRKTGLFSVGGCRHDLLLRKNGYYYLGSIEWRRARGEEGGLVNNMMASCIRGKVQWEMGDGRGNLMSSFMIERNLAITAFNTVGSASIRSSSSSSGTEKEIRLTTADPDQCGAAYCQEPIDVTQSLVLDIEFSFKITNKEGKSAYDGADGFAFVIQSAGPTAIGQGIYIHLIY